ASKAIPGRRGAPGPASDRTHKTTYKERSTVVDFTLTDEQKDLREMAHNFAEKEMRKVAWEFDKEGTWPQEIIEKAWEVGLMNTHPPEKYGGTARTHQSGR